MSKQLDEPQKPVVPKFVAEYLNYCIANELTLREAFLAGKFQLPEYLHEAVDWLEGSMNQNIFAQAWLFGYEVEKEQLYQVKLKFGRQYLSKNADGNKFSFYSCIAFPPSFSKKELESIENGAFYKIDGDKEWINPIIELVPAEQEEAE